VPDLDPGLGRGRLRRQAVDEVGATLPADSDTHTVTAKCPKGTKMTGGGAELSEPYDDFLQGSYPTGKRGWTAAGYDEGIVTAHVLCLKKKKRN
jgi:hypothetical protein